MLAQSERTPGELATLRVIRLRSERGILGQATTVEKRTIKRNDFRKYIDSSPRKLIFFSGDQAYLNGSQSKM